MLTLVRVDNRLIHGQVVEAWVPFLKVDRLVVADAQAANSPLMRAAMALAVSGSIEVRIQPPEEVDFAALQSDSTKTLLLMRDVADVVSARSRGLALDHLNLGNVHHAEGRKQLSASVYLSPAELVSLKKLSESGVEVEARAVPSDKPITLAAMEEKLS